MLTNFTMLILFQVLGGLLQQLAGLPVPGPVIGVAFLLAALILDGSVPARLDRTAVGILSYLPMLFVPATVGVIAHEGLARGEWPAIGAAAIGSSIAAISLTCMTMTYLDRWRQTDDRPMILRRD
jgi:holin-like protein